MEVQYRVDLLEAERKELADLINKGKCSARKIKRAQVLLAADQGISNLEIAKIVQIGESSVLRTKKRFVEGNLERALTEEARPGARRKLSTKDEALLIATACSEAPVGCSRWTLKLLAGEMLELTEHETLSRETIRRRLKENQLKPWQKKMWCIPKVDAEYVAKMEDVLDLYAQSADDKNPVVSFDESPTQLIGEVRLPLIAKPGSVEKYDSEYKRNGTANLFVFMDVHKPWRHIKVTDQRKFADFADCMRDLVDTHYPNADRIRVVMDNLSTHSASALYESFDAPEARRIMQRLEFHFVPKHASWLNMVEIEIGVLKKQCLDRRIGNLSELKSEIAHWENRRNANKEKIKWMFTKEKAREKMRQAYPVINRQAALSNTA